MNEPTCAVADTICRTVELGVTITGAVVDAEDRTHIFCQVLNPDLSCPGCNIAGQRRDHVDRPDRHPDSWASGSAARGGPTLHLRDRRMRNGRVPCRHHHLAAPRAVITGRTARWILQRIAIDKMSVAAVAAQLGIDWATVNTVAVESARTLVYDGGHLDGVRHLGVDEHK